MCVRCLGGEGLGVDILGSPKIGIVYEILWDFMGFHLILMGFYICFFDFIGSGRKRILVVRCNMD